VTYFYIIGGIRGPRMPRRRVSWLSTVPWVRGRRGGRQGAMECPRLRGSRISGITCNYSIFFPIVLDKTKSLLPI
jgi:hypothetical protein